MKRALLVALNTYPLPADALEAPVDEAKTWRQRLLTEYGFNEVTVPPEKECTRQRVLDEIRNLLSGVRGGDDLLIGFFGHGCQAMGWKSDEDLNFQKEHALIVYAGDSAPNGFQHATITPSDIARILKKLRPTAEARFTMVLDCCFAAMFGGGPEPLAEELRNPRVLTIPNAVSELPEGVPLTFGEIVGLVSDSTIATPLILAAARSNETEVEIGEPEDRRLLCSRQMSRRLEVAYPQHQSISSRTLIDDINDLREAQHATITGNTAGQDEPFAGGLKPQPSVIVPVSQPSVSPGIAGNAQNAAWSIDFRLLGLATLIDYDYKSYRNRIILPFDTYAPTGPLHHFGFIEVAEQDMPHPSTGAVPYKYLRAGVQYARWSLTQHRVKFGNVAGSGQPVWTSQEFKDHVPGLTVVTPDLKNYVTPRPECFFETPVAGLFNAFVDLQTGDATIGELEAGDTEFWTKNGHVKTWGPKRTSFCALFTIPLSQDHAVILLEDQNGYRTAIYVSSGATIVLGNAREPDITGPGSGEGPSEHFAVYYNLAPPKTVFDPGLPYKTAIPINACTITTYP